MYTRIHHSVIWSGGGGDGGRWAGELRRPLWELRRSIWGTPPPPFGELRRLLLGTPPTRWCPDPTGVCHRGTNWCCGPMEVLPRPNGLFAATPRKSCPDPTNRCPDPTGVRVSFVSFGKPGSGFGSFGKPGSGFGSFGKPGFGFGFGFGFDFGFDSAWPF